MRQSEGELAGLEPDVIVCVVSRQMPAVEGIGTDAALLYEAESEEVAIARDTFASVRQYVISLQEEVCICSSQPFTTPAKNLAPSKDKGRHAAPLVRLCPRLAWQTWAIPCCSSCASCLGIVHVSFQVNSA